METPKKSRSKFAPNFDPDEPDCMTLVLMGEHIDPAELAELTDGGYTNLLLLTTAAGGVVNIVLSVVKLLAGVAFNSKALLADGVHSFSDLVSDIAAAVAGYLAGRKPDEKMPWGYGKCEAVGTLWVAVMLLVAAASLIYHLYEHFKDVMGGMVAFVELSAMWVAVLSTIMKELAYQATYRVGVKINSQVLIANAWHHRSDALSSVAALVGVIVAYSGWLWADAAAGVVVTLLLSKVGFETMFEALASLVDRSANEDVEEQVREVVTGLREKGTLEGQLLTLRSRNMGRKQHLDITMSFSPSTTLGTVNEQLELLRQGLRKKLPCAGEIQIQPTTGPADGCKLLQPVAIAGVESQGPNMPPMVQIL